MTNWELLTRQQSLQLDESSRVESESAPELSPMTSLAASVGAPGEPLAHVRPFPALPPRESTRGMLT